MNRISFKRIRCLLLVIIFAEGFCLQAMAAPGQASRAAPATPAQASPYGQVLVDVRVMDRKGRPVANLKASDFKVYEDGVLQQINSFDLENVEELATAQGGNAPPAMINLSKLPRDASPQTLNRIVHNHRMIALFFDLTSMPEDDLMRAMKSATSFVRKQMAPADLVAVVTYSSGLRVVQDFTNDRDALDKAI